MLTVRLRRRESPAPSWMLLLLLGLIHGPTARAQGEAGGDAPSEPPPASAPVAPTTAGVDPFSRLRVKRPINQLPPLSSIRIRDQREEAKGKIRVNVRSSPPGAALTHFGRALGKTPVILTADSNSTPMDIVLRRPGYMTLRTRIMRRVSRTYFFKLTPAKLH